MTVIFAEKKKLDPLSIGLYALIIFAVLYVSAALGAAMDLSVDNRVTLYMYLL